MTDSEKIFLYATTDNSGYSYPYRKLETKSPTMAMAEKKFLIVVPSSLRCKFLKVAHDQVGHQDADHTLSQLLQIAYWVGMSKDVSLYCSVCSKCQHSKTQSTQPVPLQPVYNSL